MKTKWPEEVPILESGDFCRDRLSCGNRHCLLGWALRGAGLPRENFVHPKVKDVLDRAIAEVDGRYSPYGGPAVFNDDKRVSRNLLARVWNRAMYLLGYTVGNPEKKPLPKVFK